MMPRASGRCVRRCVPPPPPMPGAPSRRTAREAAIARGVAGIELITAADPAEEAAAIALVLREALEEPGKTAALVTPDRSLARRVASELARWDIAADDSAGRRLSHTPPGTFLCLLAEAAAEGFAPVPLLALLKHPLATLGGDAAAFRGKARDLDIVLRGPRPDPGLDGVRERIRKTRAGDHKPLPEARLSELEYWFAEIGRALKPLEAALAKNEAPIDAALRAHLEAGDALAGENLWRAEGGEAAARFIEELADAATALPEIESGAYAPLFRKLAGARSVRLNRTQHPRVSILGALEARLQRFDTVVLGGLNEGAWPRAVGADPWFSRPMRKTLGLEQPEFRIGQAAHDFAVLAAGPRVVLTRAQKADGVPTVASRWLQRLLQLTGGLKLEGALAPRRDYAALARSLHDAGKRSRPKRPAPTPAVEARPKRASVTEIERWVRDPYAIYARRILELDVLDALDAPIGPLERGDAIHKALERFVKEHPGPLPDDAVLTLIAIADEVFAMEGTPKAALALWRPRFAHAAAWFVSVERERRANIAASHTEIRGECEIADGFTLYGIADRIDVLSDGTAAIIDYKTGNPPTKPQTESFLTPQLPLEAAILAAGGFPGLGKLATSELLYFRVGGGRDPGDVKPVPVTLIDGAVAKLKQRIADFAKRETPYLPRLRPFSVSSEGDYDHLARVREWSLSGWEAPE